MQAKVEHAGKVRHPGSGIGYGAENFVTVSAGDRVYVNRQGWQVRAWMVNRTATVVRVMPSGLIRVLIPPTPFSEAMEISAHPECLMKVN